MSSLLLAALFAATGSFALASIVGSLRRYGATALALPARIRACSDVQEVRFRFTPTDGSRAGATILRPDFSVRKEGSRPARSCPELPAAA